MRRKLCFGILLCLSAVLSLPEGASAASRKQTSLTRGTQNSPTWTTPQKLPSGGYRSEKDTQVLIGKNATRKGIDRSNHLHFHKDGVTVTHDNRKTTVRKTQN